MVQRILARVLGKVMYLQYKGGYAWLIEQWGAYKVHVNARVGYSKPTVLKLPNWDNSVDALQLSKYRLIFEFYRKVQFWTSELVTVLEELFPG